MVSLMRHTNMQQSPALRDAIYRGTRSGVNTHEATTPSESTRRLRIALVWSFRTFRVHHITPYGDALRCSAQEELVTSLRVQKFTKLPFLVQIVLRFDTSHMRHPPCTESETPASGVF